MLLFSHSPSAWCSVLRNITKRAKRTNRLADKLRGRGAAPDPTAWFTERTTLGLGSYCLTTCTYSDDSEFVLGKTIQLLSVLLRSLLSFSLCLMGCFAAHQPNARIAQTGVADKLRGRGAAHDTTAWDAPRSMLQFSFAFSLNMR